MTTKKLLLVGDYGQDDLAFFEVKQRLYDLAKEAGISIHVDTVSVDAFNTAQTAAVVAQAAREGRYDLVYHNTAPRKDQAKQRIDNEGEPLAYTEVNSDSGKRVQVVGVSATDASGVNTFALLPEEANILQVDCHANGTQFRSRDVFTVPVIAALTEKGIALTDKIVTRVTPEDQQAVQTAVDDAGRRLAAAASEKLADHGKASEKYFTIIGSRGDAQTLINAVHVASTDAEIDFLPLKSSRGRTIEAGFAAAQLALNSRHPKERAIFVFPHEGQSLRNVSKLYNAKLDNGARIMTSDPETLVFAKPHIRSVNVLSRLATTLEDGGLPFRDTDERLDLNTIRLPEHITPAYTDGYGNIKLALSHKDLIKKLDLDNSLQTPGERVHVHVAVGEKGLDATVAGGSFDVKDGELALSRGSSGWSGKEANFAEIFRRGGNASSEFGTPQPGDHIVIQRRTIERGAEPGTVVAGGSIELEGHQPPQLGVAS